MNVYINNEISSRELDSKILLAISAASRGHQVLISDQESLVKGLMRKFLAPGIFHTKSLTPSKTKIENHKKILKTGSKITSIDEEGCLNDYKYDKFANLRFNKQTIKQSSAIFAWGSVDSKFLKKKYPNYSKKIHMTGSPRADLWQPFFSKYWKSNKKDFKKPYLLIPSSFSSSSHIKTQYERLKILKEGGYLKRDPKYLKTQMTEDYEQDKMLVSFIDAIKYISNSSKKKFKIILRPHPNESEKFWEICLYNTPNLEIIKDGSVSTWVNDAFAILHYNCTTGIESLISGKPTISYSPFKTNNKEFTTNISLKTKTIKELSRTVNLIFNQSKFKNKSNFNKSLPYLLKKKIFIDQKELASNKIINIWEKISNKSIEKDNNWAIFKLGLKIMKLNGILGGFLKRISNKNFKKKENYKFPPFNKKEIDQKVNNLQKILGIKKKINYEILSDRTLLIKQK